MNDFSQDKKYKHVIIYLFIFGLLWFHFSHIFNREYWLSLKERFTVLDLIQIIGLLCGFYLMQVVRWFILLRTYNKNIRFSDTAITCLISSAANMFFIINVGDYLKIRYFSKHLKIFPSLTFKIIFYEISLNFLASYLFYNSIDCDARVKSCSIFSVVCVSFFYCILNYVFFKVQFYKTLDFNIKVSSAFNMMYFFIALACSIVQCKLLFEFINYASIGYVHWLAHIIDPIATIVNGNLIASNYLNPIYHFTSIILGLVLAFRYRKFFRNEEIGA